MWVHLEYPVQFCSCDAKKDIFELGKVQEKVTRMIKGVDQLPYQESLHRIDWKRNDRVGVGQRSINHTRVSQGSKLGTMGALYPQGRNRGTAWREEVAGGKQRKRRGSSHNVSLKCAALCLRMLWIPAVSENSQTNSQNKGLQGTAAFHRCNSQLRGGWAPNCRLAGEYTRQVLLTKPCSYFTWTSMVHQHQREDPRSDGCLICLALPFLHSYFLSLMLKTISSDRFLLASKPSHIQVTCQSSSPENSLLSAPFLEHFSPSSLPQKRSFLEKNLLWTHLRNVPAADKETQLHCCQGELHKLHDKLCRLWHLHAKYRRCKKLDKLIHRAPDAPCFGQLISMTCQRRMTKG